MLWPDRSSGLSERWSNFSNSTYEEVGRYLCKYGNLTIFMLVRLPRYTYYVNLPAEMHNIWLELCSMHMR